MGSFGIAELLIILFMLGIPLAIAILIIVLARGRSQGTAQCPACGFALPGGAMYCSNCGSHR